MWEMIARRNGGNTTQAAPPNHFVATSLPPAVCVVC